MRNLLVFVTSETRLETDSFTKPKPQNMDKHLLEHLKQLMFLKIEKGSV